MYDIEKRRITNGAILAITIVVIMWVVKMVEVITKYQFLYEYGILPRDVSKLIGIITSAFIHSGYVHLFNNSVPLFLSVMGIVYFYPRVSGLVLLIIYIGEGLLVWLFGRPSYHIGASGVVYGYIAFLFFGGSFSRNKNLLALSLIIVFLYGTMIWGIFPQGGQISWESHLFGAACGLVCAIIFRKYSIPVEGEIREEEEEDDEDGSDNTNDQIIVNYKITKAESDLPKEQSTNTSE